MKRLLVIAAVAVIAAAGGVHARSGEWHAYLDASRVNRIQCIGDSLWCATNGGILVFDLVDSSFTQYYDGLGFRSSEVTAVVRDRSGAVWAGFAGAGVARIERLGSDATVRLYSQIIHGLLSDSVTCLAATGDEVYYGTRIGIAKFLGGVPIAEATLSDSLAGSFIHDIAVTNDTVWAGTEDGVALFVRTSSAYRFFPVGRVTSFCTRDRMLYASGAAGVLRFDGGAWTNLGLLDSRAPLVVSAGGSYLYAMSDSAVYRYDGGVWTGITGAPSAPNGLRQLLRNEHVYFANWNVLRSMAVDGQGTAWVSASETSSNRGTYLSALVGTRWINKAAATLAQNEVIKLSRSGSEGVWMSSRRLGASYRSADGEWIAYRHFRGISGQNAFSYHQYILALLADSHGYLWAGAWNQDLDRFEIHDPLNAADDVWSHFALTSGTITTNNWVKAREDPAGNRWFLSDNVHYELGEWGINILSADGTQWLSVNPETAPGMETGNIFDVAFGGGGRVYLAIRGYGVQVWNAHGYDWTNLANLADDSWTTLLPPEIFASTELNCIALGSNGAVWVGTASGLYRSRFGTTDEFTAKMSSSGTGLIGANVRDLAFDGEGNLWVGTNLGLNRIRRGDSIDAWTTAEAWETGLQFIYPSSVISPLPGASINALLFEPAENALYIGTDNGLAWFDITPPAPPVFALDETFLYPNPVVASGGGELRIGRISSPVSIQVFTLEGELVHEATHVQEGEVAWDLLTLNGYRVQPGVYIVKVTAGQRTVFRKVGVIK